MPFISNNNSVFDISEITEVLQEEIEEQGIAVTPEILTSGTTVSKVDDRDKLKKALNKNQASVEHASSVISEIMHFSKIDNTRLKAAEVVLDCHDVRSREGKTAVVPTI